MKAFKGCVNESCGVYRKKHYKENDKYCIECGQKLYFVCADCWKQFEDNKTRYCIVCDAVRKDKKDKRIAAIKDGGKKGVAVLGAAAVVVKGVADNAKQIQMGAKVIVDAGAQVAKLIAKK